MALQALATLQSPLARLRCFICTHVQLDGELSQHNSDVAYLAPGDPMLRSPLEVDTACHTMSFAL